MGLRRIALGTALVLALAALCLLSCSVGARPVPLSEVLAVILGGGEGFSSLVVAERIPRTVFSLAAGAALGVSGLLMQEMTRNPIADPSILGVNTGAALAVVIGIVHVGITTATQYMAFAVAGAALAAVFVFGVGSIGGGGASPLRLALAGTAVSMALSSLVSIVIMPSGNAMNAYRFWQVGSVGGASWEGIRVFVPVLVVGTLAALALASSLEVLALGDETAVSLGARPGLIRAGSALVGVLLCGATTAIAGPIAFVGLMVPHMVRALFKLPVRAQVALCCVFGAAILLVSDIVGRLFSIAAGMGELEVGIVTAILGAPVLAWVAVFHRPAGAGGGGL